MPGTLHAIPPPDARNLLPPLLACLATANATPQPPPALLPLLSPILSQRVQLLASKDWLSLLCWDGEAASRLPEIVGNLHVEPHPASGEIEVEDPDEILYRRSDAETIHARLILGEYGIAPTYLWCTGGEQGDRWGLSELRGIENIDDGTEWFKNMSEAADAGIRRKEVSASSATRQHPGALQPVPQSSEHNDEEEDDGSYWAAYDQTPAQTPHKHSPAPQTNSRVQVGPTQTELEYFARYASEVQPAMDPHDPDEEAAGPGESTLNGNSFGLAHQQPQGSTRQPADATQNVDNDRRDSPYDSKPEHIESINEDSHRELSHPRPSSSASTNSVERLEREAQNSSQAELAIKQHISTDIKSLFRLARASGIQREEFERIIKRELEVLPLLEQMQDSHGS